MKQSVLFRLFAAMLMSTGSLFSQSSINLFEDSHAPFIYGVASGDPTSTSVIIWTATEAKPQWHGETVSWKIATDTLLSNVVQSGNTFLDSSRGYTLKIEVSQLQPDTRYFYSFSIGGNASATGITRTAPSANSNKLKFALVSCSSLFSGFFNGYRQIASMTDLNGLIHVGDYIYDFVDPDERVRIPQPEPPNPGSSIVEDWRNRHRLYLLDPDLREARRVLPWVVTWDNHDVLRNNPSASSKAFREFVPFTEDVQDSLKIWRKLRFGNLLDIMMIDINVEARKETLPSGNPAVMTNNQFQWLKHELTNSTATWKFIGSQKLFSHWNLQGISLPGSGLNNTWNGFAENRDSLLALIQQNNIHNFVVLSGDLHMNVWSDISRNPFDSTAYDRKTGNGSLGIEIMCTSLSRGNVDESGISVGLKNFLHQSSLALNPHQQYINLYDHGFNVVSITPDSLTAYSYLCPILTNNNNINTEAVRKSLVNENRWQRQLVSSVKELNPSNTIPIFPNPSKDGFFTIDLTKLNGVAEVLAVDVMGKIVVPKQRLNPAKHQLNSKKLQRGIYFVEIAENGKRYIERIVVAD